MGIILLTPANKGEVFILIGDRRKFAQVRIMHITAPIQEKIAIENAEGQRYKLWGLFKLSGHA